jgi:hypothetical protein
MKMAKVIVGTLHTGKNGNWFECADENAGTEANIFESEEKANEALDFLGWSDVEIYDLADVEERCGKI